MLIKENRFSLCFSQNGGFFSIGDNNSNYLLNQIKYFPYENKKNLYSIKLQDVVIDKKENIVSSDYFTTIDSGTTLSYFPLNLYEKLKNKTNDFISDKYLGKIFDTDMGICIKLNKNTTFSQFKAIMPTLKFIFLEDIIYEWNPESYLFNNTESCDILQTFCMGFLSWK